MVKSPIRSQMDTPRNAASTASCVIMSCVSGNSVVRSSPRYRMLIAKRATSAGFRWLRRWRGHRLNPGPPQADAQARARNLQRANGDADQFGDFLAALAVLDQILDLLDALGREFDLTHFSFILFCVQRLRWGRLSSLIPDSGGST